MRPELNLPPPVKVSWTIGGLLDVPTGEYLVGTHDQRVLHAGISNITGIVGPGNCFKTTIMRWMILSALSRIYGVAGLDSLYWSYDTEINLQENRNIKLSHSFDVFKDKNIVDEKLWQATDKVEYSGNEYWALIKEQMGLRKGDKKSKRYDTAFLDRDGKTPLKVLAPWFFDFDSLSQFITADVEKMMDDTEIGQSAGNTIFMRQGLAKARMLLEMPTVAGSGFGFFVFTAHIGTKIEMPAGPGTPPPRKQLQHMPGGEVIKGVSNNFFYLLHNLWLIHSARPFINQGTKAPEYPYAPGDEVPGDLDLNIVTMRQLRGKNGASGFGVDLLVSQREGVLPYLSEFHYIKGAERYGLEGSDRNYALALAPETSLSRTTVRQKLRESKRLQRAVEITSQLCQLEIFHPYLKDQLLKPAELYKVLGEKGYDWEMILTMTRSYHTLDDEVSLGYPLSTLDLCRMAQGKYHPYWLSEDNKTIKPEYQKKKMKQASN